MADNRTTDWRSLLNKANEFELRTLIREFAEQHEDFKAFVSRKLAPPIVEEDFDTRLGDVIAGATDNRQIGNNYWEITTDWREVYYDLILPWEKEADKLSTEGQFKLIMAILENVGMAITEEDFNNDDWHGNDFSGSIRDINNSLLNIFQLFILRGDLDCEGLDNVEDVVNSIINPRDIAGEYVGSTYGSILDLIQCRRNNPSINVEVYDCIIDNSDSHQRGNWICEKIEFMRSLGLTDEAENVLMENLKYHPVALKYLGELKKAERWQDALVLLDRLQYAKDHPALCDYLHYDAPDWMKLKQEILDNHGLPEDRIENLKKLFYKASSQDKEEYYNRLKELIDPKDWKDFYLALIDKCHPHDRAKFLVKENELERLFSLIRQYHLKHESSYSLLLEYGALLKEEHEEDLKSMLRTAFIQWAKSNFMPGEKCGYYFYEAFAGDLKHMKEIGFESEANELRDYFVKEYWRRRNLTTVLNRLL